ncbi:MAG: hypothetical protein GF307_13960 [candidate division Zixibacteria bacterium]|nr:hypothetical protein [candidate division Zixibacteria bacterium]
MEQNKTSKWAMNILKIITIAIVFRIGVIILSLMAFNKPVLGGIRNYNIWYVVMDIAVAVMVFGLSEFSKSKRRG